MASSTLSRFFELCRRLVSLRSSDRSCSPDDRVPPKTPSNHANDDVLIFRFRWSRADSVAPDLPIDRPARPPTLQESGNGRDGDIGLAACADATAVLPAAWERRQQDRTDSADMLRIPAREAIVRCRMSTATRWRRWRLSRAPRGVDARTHARTHTHTHTGLRGRAVGARG